MRRPPYSLYLAILVTIFGVVACGGRTDSAREAVQPGITAFAFAGVSVDTSSSASEGSFRDLLTWNWTGVSATLEMGELDANNEFVPKGSSKVVPSKEGSGAFSGWEFQSPGSSFHTYRLVANGSEGYAPVSGIIRQCVRVGDIPRDPIKARILINGKPLGSDHVVPISPGQPIEIGFVPGTSGGCDEPIVQLILTDQLTGERVKGGNPWTVTPTSDCTYQIAETRRDGALSTYQVQLKVSGI